MNEDPIIPRFYEGEPVIGIGDSPYWEDNKDSFVSANQSLFDKIVVYVENFFDDLLLTKIYAITPDEPLMGPFSDATLNSIMMPDTLIFIGEGAFFRLEVFPNDLVFPPSIKIIEREAFACNSLTEFELPSQLVYLNGIGRGWYMCDWYDGNDNDISSVTIPNSVEVIGYAAIRDAGLTEVIIPNNVIEIEGYAFAMNDLTQLVLPTSLEVLGEQSLSNNSNLTSITINASGVTIGNSLLAFGNDEFRTAYNSEGPGTYTAASPEGPWTKE